MQNGGYMEANIDKDVTNASLTQPNLLESQFK